jgi:predicted TIM-barrel fold metal-dependent hydrolase
MIAANPARILWATNWPHTASPPESRPVTDVTPRRDVDDVRIFNQLAVWAPDTAVRKAILMDNPARLFRFQ